MSTVRQVDQGRYREIIDLLRTDGGRVTATRKAVVRALLEFDDHHVTAAEITASVRGHDPEFQESTVYRTLERLIEVGAVSQNHMGPGPAVFHLVGTHHEHHHLLCTRCRAVIEVPPTLLAVAARKAARDYGFAVQADHFVLTGLCADCRRTSRQ